MKSRLARGIRDSQWSVLCRCLAIIRRVQRGPADGEDLLRAVLEQEGPNAYGDDEGEARRIRLEKDLARIRDKLGVEIYADRQIGGYVIRDTWLPLLDLPDEDLATIAWLEQTFGHDSPQHDEVHALLGRLRLYLPPNRRAEIERRRNTLLVDLGQRDQDEIPATLWDALTRALSERRRVEFLYQSPRYSDGIPHRHVVDPWERYFDTVRGHYYLHGWCHYSLGPQGREEQGHYIDYRLGRMRELQLLPEKLPPQPPPAPHYRVEYELAPELARLGVSRPRGIRILQVERHEDGSARVLGQAESLFWAAQALLPYGAGCRVLGGPQLRRQMQEIVRKMAEIYAEDE